MKLGKEVVLRDTGLGGDSCLREKNTLLSSQCYLTTVTCVGRIQCMMSPKCLINAELFMGVKSF